MIGYAVIRYSRFTYRTRATNEIEKIFELEEQAWEYIEYLYYNTIDLNKICSAILLINNNPLRRRDIYVGEFQINSETHNDTFKICRVQIVFRHDNSCRYSV